MKKRLLLLVFGFSVVVGLFSFSTKSNTVKASEGVVSDFVVECNARSYCNDNAISYNLVKTVADYTDKYTELELAMFFNTCHSEDELDYIEPADAIMFILDCSYDKALHILEESAALDV